MKMKYDKLLKDYSLITELYCVSYKLIKILC